MSTVKKDPQNYRNLSVPFENIDAVNTAMAQFFDDINELRKKYKIPDVLITAKGSYKDSTGEETTFLTSHSFGDSGNQMAMAAYTYGVIKTEQNELINKLLTGKKQ